MDAAIIIFTSFTLLLLVGKLFISNKAGNKSLPPSPPSVPILGHLHHLHKPLHQSLAALSARHGPLLLLRFGQRRALVVSSRSLADECLAANDHALANRPQLPSQRARTYNYTTMGSAAYGAAWRELRRIAAVEVLSGHRLTFFADVRAEEARYLARRLLLDFTPQDEFRRVELPPRLFGLAMNVIMRMMAGKGYYGDGEARRFEDVVKEEFALAGASNVGDFLPSALGWFFRRRVTAKIARIHSYKDQLMQQIIDQRRREKGGSENEQRDGQTMVDSLLALQRSSPDQYTDLFIKTLIGVILREKIGERKYE